MKVFNKISKTCLVATALLLALPACTEQPVVVNNYYTTNSDESVIQTESVPEEYVEESSNPASSSTSKVNSSSLSTYEFGSDNNLKLNTTYYVTGTKNYLALRNAPYYDGNNETAQLSNGDTVEVLSQTTYGDKGEYCYISVTSGKAKGKKGYVNSSYISVEKGKTNSSAASSGANKTTTSSKAASSQKVESVSLTVNYNTNNTTYAVVEGKNGKNVVWSYRTSDYPSAQNACASEIGQKNGIYYFVEGGTVVALNVQSGSVVWKNDEFEGSAVTSAFTEDAIYICGALGPDLFIVDYNGKTISKKKSISSEYYWPSKIEVNGDVIAITMSGSGSGLDVPKTLYVDKSGNLIDNSSESNGGSAVSIDSAYSTVIGEYSSYAMLKYYQFDMNGDSIPELIIDYGTCEQDRIISFYTFKNNKVESIGGNFSGMHAVYYKDNSTGKLCTASVFAGSDNIYVVWYQYDGNSVSIAKQSDEYVRGLNETTEQTLNNKGSFTALN